MKLIVAVMMMVVALSAAAQHRPPYPYPIPFPPRDPFPTPLPPMQQCLGERYDRALAATEAAALDKLDRFAALKNVTCSLTQSHFESARGRCVDAEGALYATLKMSFVVDCYTRDVSSRLRKTVIKYY